MYHLDIETHHLSPKYTIPPISPILIDYITVILGTQINSFECVFPLYHHSLILRGFQELPSSISPLPFSLPLIWHRLFLSPLCTVPVTSYLSPCFPSLCFNLFYNEMKSCTVSLYLNSCSIFLSSHCRGHITCLRKLGCASILLPLGFCRDPPCFLKSASSLWLLASFTSQKACFLQEIPLSNSVLR